MMDVTYCTWDRRDFILSWDLRYCCVINGKLTVDEWTVNSQATRSSIPLMSIVPSIIEIIHCRRQKQRERKYFDTQQFWLDFVNPDNRKISHCAVAKSYFFFCNGDGRIISRKCIQQENKNQIACRLSWNRKVATQFFSNPKSWIINLFLVFS